MANSKHQIIFTFDTKELLEIFTTWLCDAGGEQGFMDCVDINEILTSDQFISMNYDNCFPAWGWDGKSDQIVKVEIKSENE